MTPAAHSACPACGAESETLLGCAACGALAELPPDASPFAIFGLPLSHALDPADLRRRLLRFSRMTHPDYFGGADTAMRERAERASAALNDAHGILADPVRRADRVVRELGGPSDGELREMPQAFLMEVLDWNETLEAAREAAAGSPERAALETLAAALRTERATAVDDISRGLDPLPEPGAPDLADVRRRLNAVRYLDRTLSEIEALRLQQAASG